MKLTTMHKLLMGAAIGAACLFGAWALTMFSRRDSVAHLVIAIAAGGVAAGIGLYLRFFIRKTRAIPKATS